MCADPSLLALDRRMVELLAAAGPPAQAATLEGFEPQQDWFRRRSLCAFSARHSACLKAAYRDRIDLLSALAGQASGQGHLTFPARCSGAPWGNGPVSMHETEHGALLIEDGRGRVLAIASARQPRDDWSPFLRIVKEKRAIRFESSEGTVARCRVHRPQ